MMFLRTTSNHWRLKPLKNCNWTVLRMFQGKFKNCLKIHHDKVIKYLFQQKLFGINSSSVLQYVQ